jgi:hypothetical protein
MTSSGILLACSIVPQPAVLYSFQSDIIIISDSSNGDLYYWNLTFRKALRIYKLYNLVNNYFLLRRLLSSGTWWHYLVERYKQFREIWYLHLQDSTVKYVRTMVSDITSEEKEETDWELQKGSERGGAIQSSNPLTSPNQPSLVCLTDLDYLWLKLTRQ